MEGVTTLATDRLPAQACTAGADACMSEADEHIPALRTCIRLSVDCADICDVTGRVMSRHTGDDVTLARSILQACVAVCASCAEECERHADQPEHCQICADGCRRCEQACRQLMQAMR